MSFYKAGFSRMQPSKSPQIPGFLVKRVAGNQKRSCIQIQTNARWDFIYFLRPAPYALRPAFRPSSIKTRFGSQNNFTQIEFFIQKFHPHPHPHPQPPPQLNPPPHPRLNFTSTYTLNLISFSTSSSTLTSTSMSTSN